jgi:hypothetical protein
MDGSSMRYFAVLEMISMEPYLLGRVRFGALASLMSIVGVHRRHRIDVKRERIL